MKNIREFKKDIDRFYNRNFKKYFGSEVGKTVAMFLGALVALGIFVGLMIMGKLLVTANRRPHYQEQVKIEAQSLKLQHDIYLALEQNNLLSIGATVEIRHLEAEAETTDAKAQQLWHEIPYGAVIMRNGVTVGKYTRVSDLRVEAKNIRKSIDKKKLKIAGKQGDILLNTPDARFWKDFREAESILKNIYEDNKKFDGTLQGIVAFILRVLGFVLIGLAGIGMIPSVIACMMLGMQFIFLPFVWMEKLFK